MWRLQRYRHSNPGTPGGVFRIDVGTARLVWSSCGVTDHCVVSYGKYRALTSTWMNTDDAGAGAEARERAVRLSARVHHGADVKAAR